METTGGFRSTVAMADMNRRAFLATTGAAALTAVAPMVATASAATGTITDVRAGTTSR